MPPQGRQKLERFGANYTYCAHTVSGQPWVEISGPSHEAIATLPHHARFSFDRLLSTKMEMEQDSGCKKIAKLKNTNGMSKHMLAMKRGTVSKCEFGHARQNIN